jgi:hypothetical protein
MTISYSTNLQISLIGTGDQAGVWGDTTNTNLGTLLEQGIAGYVEFIMGDGVNPITMDNGVSCTARNMYITLTGTLTADATLVIPFNKKLYFVFNNTVGGYGVTVKVSGQTGVLVPNNAKVLLVCNGVDAVNAVSTFVDNITVNGTLRINSDTYDVEGVTATTKVVNPDYDNNYGIVVQNAIAGTGAGTGYGVYLDVSNDGLAYLGTLLNSPLLVTSSSITLMGDVEIAFMTNTQQAMIITSDQKIGIGGVPNPSERLVVAGNIATEGNITATGNITAYYSDERLKTNLGRIEDALKKVLTLDGFHYEANETAQALGYEVKPEVGVSAQQVQAVLPEVVAPAPIDGQYLTVRYERLIPLLIEAIKEQNGKIVDLEQKLENLQAKIERRHAIRLNHTRERMGARKKLEPVVEPVVESGVEPGVEVNN